MDDFLKQPMEALWSTLEELSEAPSGALWSTLRATHGKASQEVPLREFKKTPIEDFLEVDEKLPREAP